MTKLDLGITAAKRQNQDVLMKIMRTTIKENSELNNKAELITIACETVLDHRESEQLLHDALRYCMTNMYQRCAMQSEKKKAQKENEEHTQEHIYNTIANDSMIMWWNFTVPTTGKKLPDSTFQEVKEAAHFTGKSLSRLCQMGAPGTMVREVFKNQKMLQEFFVNNP